MSLLDLSWFTDSNKPTENFNPTLPFSSALQSTVASSHGSNQPHYQKAVSSQKALTYSLYTYLTSTELQTNSYMELLAAKGPDISTEALEDQRAIGLFSGDQERDFK